jgi:predicted nucleic acid-binding protein
MTRLVILDSGPLGMYATAQGGSPKNTDCKQRVNELLANGADVRVPGIADYEVRRSLVLLTHQQPTCKAIQRLDLVKATLGFLPITNEVMMKAAEIWGLARSRGIVTAPPEGIDGDVILAAQAQIAQNNFDVVEVATTNSGDLGRLGLSILNWDDLKQP